MKNTNEFKRDMKEVFDYKETPIVSLPQFVIDRIKPALEASNEPFNHPTFNGELTFINGIDENGKKLEDDPKWQEFIPMGMPKLTKEFEEWRDDWGLNSLRQMKIVLALIYNYKLEDDTNE